jgi:hypothetical protein
MARLWHFHNAPVFDHSPSKARWRMICHRTFVDDSVLGGFFKLASTKEEEMRSEAEKFMNEVGAERVVEITEHMNLANEFVIVVWYREDKDSDNKGPPS